MRATRKICSIALALLLFCAGMLFQGMSKRFALMAADEELENPMARYDSALDEDEQGELGPTQGITGGRGHGQGMRQRANEPQDSGMRQRGKNFIKTHKKD